MNRDEAIRRAEIAMAWARGEVVQYRIPYILGGQWDDVTPVGGDHVPSFFDDKLKGEWRIKPKPLECWAYVPENEELRIEVWLSNECPITALTNLAHAGRWVRMREVE